MVKLRNQKAIQNRTWYDLLKQKQFELKYGRLLRNVLDSSLFCHSAVPQSQSLNYWINFVGVFICTLFAYWITVTSGVFSSGSIVPLSERDFFTDTLSLFQLLPIKIDKTTHIAPMGINGNLRPCPWSRLNPAHKGPVILPTDVTVVKIPIN